jgi:UDP-N-acetylglucosamine 2-epimerase (non-hydrolysing)
VNDLGLQTGQYLLVTLHRPVNVDQPKNLYEIMGALVEISRSLPVVFPVHPRTSEQLTDLGFRNGDHPGLHLLQPLGYLDFLTLMKSACLVLTDSGGIQEETTFLGIPCLTARPNTERPVTVEVGTNRLVESTPQAVLQAVQDTLNGKSMHRNGVPELWDGAAAKRIVQVFQSLVRP